MELKSYIVDNSILGMYVSPKHEVKTDKGYVTYRIIEGDNELELKKQGDRAVTTRRIYLGQRIHSTDDPTEQKFLESKPWFGTKLKIYDPLAENKKKEAELMRDADIIAKVSTISDNTDLVKYAYRLFGNSALEKAGVNDYAGIRVDLIRYTVENPEEMIELMSEDSKSSEYLEAGLFFVKGIIKETDSGTSVSWGDNDTKFLSVVVGQRPLDAVVDFFGTVEGKEVRQLAGQKMETIVKDNLAKADTKANTPAKK